MSEILYMLLNALTCKTVEYTLKFTYLRRQIQPMQMTVTQIIKAAPAIITMTTSTVKTTFICHITTDS